LKCGGLSLIPIAAPEPEIQNNVKLHKCKGNGVVMVAGWRQWWCGVATQKPVLYARVRHNNN
jgi:hypothetical protein